MKYGNRSPLKHIVSSPLTIIALLVVVFFMGKAAWSIHTKASVAAEKLAQTQAELNKLETQKTDLAGKVQYLSTDSGVEAEIRTKYRAVREGESVAVIVDDTSQTASVSQATTTTSWWHKLLHLFGKKD